MWSNVGDACLKTANWQQGIRLSTFLNDDGVLPLIQEYFCRIYNVMNKTIFDLNITIYMCLQHSNVL